MTITTDHALDHLAAATSLLAHDEGPLTVRLQACWNDHVQHVWEQACLSPDLALTD